MAEQSSSARSGPGRYESIADDADLVMSDHPQNLHQEKLPLGIEEVTPGLVVLRKMGDIQALTGRTTVRQFGGGEMASVMSSGGEGADLGLGGHHVAIPLELNGAEHTKWRKILDPVFTPKKIAVLEPRVHAGERPDRRVRRPRRSGRLRGVVRAAAFVDLPVDHGDPGRRSSSISCRSRTSILAGARSSRPAPPSADAGVRPMRRSGSPPSSTGARRIRRVRRRSHRLAHASTEVDGRPVTRDELHGICNLLMIAGLDTVAASLRCILAHLARATRTGASAPRRAVVVAVGDRGDHAVRVAGDRRGSVMWSRTSSSRAARSRPGRPRSCGGRRPTSTRRRSRSRWTVDLDRTPNAHICFASGWHRCLGSHLARMELRAALDVWHSRIPDYQIADGVELRYSVNPRAPHHLPLTWMH